MLVYDSSHDRIKPAVRRITLIAAMSITANPILDTHFSPVGVLHHFLALARK